MHWQLHQRKIMMKVEVSSLQNSVWLQEVTPPLLTDCMHERGNSMMKLSCCVEYIFQFHICRLLLSLDQPRWTIRCEQYLSINFSSLNFAKYSYNFIFKIRINSFRVLLGSLVLMHSLAGFQDFFNFEQCLASIEDYMVKMVLLMVY